MSAEGAIRTRLLAVSAVTALVGQRVYRTRASQDSTLPLLVYTRVSTVRESAMGADPGNVAARFQVSSLSSSQSEAMAVATAAREALQRWRGTADGTVIEDIFVVDESEISDLETNRYGHAFDALVHYLE